MLLQQAQSLVWICGFLSKVLRSAAPFGQWWEVKRVFVACKRTRNWENVRVWCLESMWIALDAAAYGGWWFSGGKLGRSGTPIGDWIEFSQRNSLVSISMKAPPNGFLAGSGEGVVILELLLLVQFHFPFRVS